VASNSCAHEERTPLTDQSATSRKLVRIVPARPLATPWQEHRRVVNAGSALLVAGVALAAANLRPAVTSVAAILGEVRAALGASAAWASVLTSVPTLCFGLAGVAGPWLGRRWGMNRAVVCALTLVTAGLVVRVLGGPAVLLAGTFATCVGIAVCNVLIPVVVKEFFPHRIGPVTSVYTAGLAAGGGLGAALTPSAEGPLGGWRITLFAWAGVGAVALAVWLVHLRRAGSGGAPVEAARPEPGRSLLRTPLAWVVSGLFGLQAFVAYTVMGWLPEVLASAGVGRTTAGLLLGLTNLLGVPISLVVPTLAARCRSQSGWAVGLVCFGITGMLGLLLAPSAAPTLWTVLIGIGIGLFPLALTLITLRSSNPADTARLSVMAQSVGYLIAALGPFLFGMLHGETGGWAASLLLVLAAQGVLAVLGVLAGRPRTV